MDLNGEHTFLCGYQRIRRYGSTQDLNSPSISSSGYRKATQIIPHRVEPSDTLQSLELKYNSNMYEIKRLNRLWSNDSLHCKTIINIPIYDSSSQTGTPINSAAQTPTDGNKKFNPKKKAAGNVAANLEVVNESESLEDFFKRIDSSVKQTQKSVKRLIKKGG